MEDARQQTYEKEEEPFFQQIIETMQALKHDNEEVNRKAQKFQKEWDRLHEEARANRDES